MCLWDPRCCVEIWLLSGGLVCELWCVCERFGGVWRFGCCLEVWFVNCDVFVRGLVVYGGLVAVWMFGLWCAFERFGGVWRFGCCLFVCPRFCVCLWVDFVSVCGLILNVIWLRVLASKWGCNYEIIGWICLICIWFWLELVCVFVCWGSVYWVLSFCILFVCWAAV